MIADRDWTTYPDISTRDGLRWHNVLSTVSLDTNPDTANPQATSPMTWQNDDPLARDREAITGHIN